jgi:hypothetical protein
VVCIGCQVATLDIWGERRVKQNVRMRMGWRKSGGLHHSYQLMGQSLNEDRDLDSELISSHLFLTSCLGQTGGKIDGGKTGKGVGMWIYLLTRHLGPGVIEQ